MRLVPDGVAMSASIALDDEASQGPGDYLDQVAGRFGKTAARPRQPRQPTLQSHTVWRNERAMIRVRGRVTPAQKKQIEHLGALLANILEEDRS